MPASAAKAGIIARPERTMLRPMTTKSAAPSRMPGQDQEEQVVPRPVEERDGRRQRQIREQRPDAAPSVRRAVAVGGGRCRPAVAVAVVAWPLPTRCRCRHARRQHRQHPAGVDAAALLLGALEPVALLADEADLRVAVDRARSPAGRSMGIAAVSRATARSRGRSAARRTGRHRRRCRTGCSGSRRRRTSRGRVAWASARRSGRSRHIGRSETHGVVLRLMSSGVVTSVSKPVRMKS